MNMFLSKLNIIFKREYRVKFGPLPEALSDRKDQEFMEKLEKSAGIRLKRFFIKHKKFCDPDFFKSLDYRLMYIKWFPYFSFFENEYHNTRKYDKSFSSYRYHNARSAFDFDVQYQAWSNFERLFPWPDIFDGHFQINKSRFFSTIAAYLLRFNHNPSQKGRMISNLKPNIIDYLRRLEHIYDSKFPAPFHGTEPRYICTPMKPIEGVFFEIYRIPPSNDHISQFLEQIAKVKNRDFTLKQWEYPLDPDYLAKPLPRYFLSNLKKKTKYFRTYPSQAFRANLLLDWKKYSCRPLNSFPKDQKIVRVEWTGFGGVMLFKFYFARSITINSRLNDSTGKINFEAGVPITNICYGFTPNRDTWPPLLLLPFYNKTKNVNNRKNGVFNKKFENFLTINSFIMGSDRPI
jgi:hypothetical protein